MRKVFLGDYLLYCLAKTLGFILRIIPVTTALFIGRRMGGFSILFSKKRARIAYANLKAAFGTKYSPKELKRILKRTYENIGQGIVEVLLLPKLDERYIKRYIKFENFHFAEEALKKGKGLIFLTAHFGNWEISHAALPFKNLAYTGIAREQKPYLLNGLLNRYRESKGCRIVSKGPAVREALRALRSNGIAGMLVDQDAGKAGIFVELFGREASWNRGVMEIALKTGATIVSGFAIREKGPYIRLKLFKPVEFLQNKNKEEVIKDAFRQYILALEEVIKKYPDQWLWQHRRWKSTPVRNVLILNDKRTGHLRQSEAVVESLKNIWQRKGYDLENINPKVVDVEFKNNFCKRLFLVSSNFSHSNCYGCMSCLHFCLKEGSYKALIQSPADIVVSCGSSTAGVNLLLSKENNAKSVVIMKPAFLSIKKFNMAIIPEHDNPPRLNNVVITDGALNLIDRERMGYYKSRLIEKTAPLPLKDNIIGVLIGGATKASCMDTETIDSLLDNLIKASDKYDCDILLTTSRRTPEAVERLIKKKLQNEQRCKLLIIANENNIEGVIEGILGLSGIILAPEDSISMISEAASSGSHTIVFKQKGLAGKRHQAFLQHLSKNNFVKVAAADEIYNSISEAFSKDAKQRVLNDRARVEKALERLL